MKLALDLGTRLVSAAWSTTGSPDPLPLKDGTPFVDNLLLWRQQKVVAIGEQARGQLHQLHSADDGIVLEGYRPDFARHRLRYLTGADDDDPQGDESVRRSTRISDIHLPVESSGPGYDGPFYRHGLARAQGGLLRQLWQRLRRLDPVSIDRCEGLVLSCPLAFHEFSRRRVLHSLKEGLADELFPFNEFYQRAIDRVSFVDEPLAILAGLEHLYGGRGRAQIRAARPKTVITIDVGAGFCTAAVFQVTPGGAEHAITPGRMLGERSRLDCAGDAVDRAILACIRTRDADLDMYVSSRWAEPAFRVPLMDNIRRVKAQFSDPAVGEVSLAVPDGGDYVPISREQLAPFIKPLARQAGQAVAEALMDARVAVGELGAAVLVGGTMLLPEFQQAVREQLPGVSTIAPDAAHAADACLAVVKGLANWEDIVAPAAGMAPTNRRVALYNCNWSPQEQFPPPSEQFVEMYDPQRPQEHKHKDFWWAYLQVPPGFAKLTVSLFASTSREDHLFTLYGIPVDNPDEATVPERYQVYVDVTGNRIYPRIWVWDIHNRRFLAKAFDLSRQSELRLTDWIEAERAAFSYFDGDRFTGKRDEPLAWLPAVKRLAVGDYVRVGGGDRDSADWTGVDPDNPTGPRVPVRVVTGIRPRGAAAASLPEVRNWHLSEFEVSLDDEPPRNLQNLLVEHIPDGQRDAQLLLSIHPQALAPMAAVTADTLADAMGTAPVSARPTPSGRASRAPRLAPDAPTGDALDAFDSADPLDAEVPQMATPLRDESGTDAIPLEASPFAQDGSGSWTSGHATWAAAAPMAGDVDAMPDSWADSSDGSPAMSTQDLIPPSALRAAELAEPMDSHGSLPAILRELRERGIPETRAEARDILRRLLQNVIDGRVPAPMAAAAATIIRAHFDLSD